MSDVGLHGRAAGISIACWQPTAGAALLTMAGKGGKASVSLLAPDIRCPRGRPGVGTTPARWPARNAAQRAGRGERGERRSAGSVRLGSKAGGSSTRLVAGTCGAHRRVAVKLAASRVAWIGWSPQGQDRSCHPGAYHRGPDALPAALHSRQQLPWESDQSEPANPKKSPDNHNAFDLSTEEDNPEGDVHQDGS